MTDTLRKTDFETLFATLNEQQERKVDLVAPATDLCFKDGNLRVRRSDQEPVLTDSGVGPRVETYVPNDVFDEGVAQRIGMPRAFLRTLRETGRTDIIDGTLNALIHGKRDIHPAMDKKFLVRMLKDADGGEAGTARALLSNAYKIVDHKPTLLAALAGMRAAGLGAENITQCDLTGKRMYVQVSAPEIKAYAPRLLKDYVSPFTGNRGADNPAVFAGFVLTNSETGHGQFALYPRLTVEVCTNGMVLRKDVQGQRHVGARLDSGLIRTSERTHAANLELITSQAQDIVETFLDVRYVEAKVAEMEEKAGAPVKEPEKAIKEVTQKLEFPSMYDDVLAHFIKGGDITRGGIMQAITAAAQSDDIDADLAFRMEERALSVL